MRDGERVMVEDLCAPYASCDDLDGQLLINRTADGPAIGVEIAEMPFGPVTMKGASLHPYVRWTYGQSWSAKEACLGPARSVLGLAPGERVTIEVTHRESVDTTKLVREAAERSNTLSRTERRPILPPSLVTGGGSGGSGDAEKQKEEMADQMAEKMHELQKEQMNDAKYLMSTETRDGQVELQPLHYGELGSPFLELIVGAIVGAVAGGKKQPSADAAIDAAAKQMEHESKGGAGTINYDTNQRIGEIVEEVQRSERQSTVSESTTTTRASTEQRVTRTFANPYRDRTLELRFFPVFRRFEITTTVLKAEPGVLMRPGPIDFAVANPRASLGSFLETRVDTRALATTALADPGEEREGAAFLRTSALSEHLTANAAQYTRRFVAHADQTGSQDALMTPLARMVGGDASARGEPTAAGGANLADGLAWSRAHVKNGEVHVPLAEPANWPPAWQKVGDGLAKAIGTTIGDAAWRKTWTTTRSVHLFMGTHVEAVAGACILEDVPPA
jgi:hypothetical protein